MGDRTLEKTPERRRLRCNNGVYQHRWFIFFSFVLFCFLFFLNFPGFMPFLFLDSEPGQSDLTTCSACHGVVFNLHFENGWDNTLYKIYFHHVHLYHNYRHNIIINERNLDISKIDVEN